MARILPTKISRRSARPRAGARWPDAKTALEVKVAFWLFLVIVAGLVLLRFVT